MRFKQKLKAVDARTLSETIQTEQGEVLAEAGDWLIRNHNGEYSLCKADAFTDCYEPLDGPNS